MNHEKNHLSTRVLTTRLQYVTGPKVNTLDAYIVKIIVKVLTGHVLLENENESV